MPTFVAEDTLNCLTEDLKELAKKPKLRSLKDAIALLQPYIDQVLALGYTIEDVAEVLQKRDLKVTPKTLKRYLAEVRSALQNSEESPREANPSKSARQAPHSNESTPQGSAKNSAKSEKAVPRVTGQASLPSTVSVTSITSEGMELEDQG